MSAAGAGERLVALDFVRGVAVMGILLANLPAFALPGAAYFSPLAAGGHEGLDRAAWYLNFVFVEGRFRGLFSLLFGASMLLVIDRARAAGESAAQVHYARMAALFAIGLVHLYLLWWGDILSHYALVGAVAYLFARLPARWLFVLALLLLALQQLFTAGTAWAHFDAAARDTASRTAFWEAMRGAFGVPSIGVLAAESEAVRGGFLAGVGWRWQHAMSPLMALWVIGPETLGAMLLGMAGFRSGFLTGTWPRRRYVLIAATCLPLSLAAYAAAGVVTMRHGFAQEWVYLGAIGVTPVPRTLGMLGYAALLLLLMRPGGRWTARIAAAGRTAFTNYLGTSLLMAFVFYGWGLGQFGAWPRAAIYLLAPLAWALMLGWAQPWLERHRQGPLEWLWRSLARLSPQPMRKVASGPQ